MAFNKLSTFFNGEELVAKDNTDQQDNNNNQDTDNDIQNSGCALDRYGVWLG